MYETKNYNKLFWIVHTVGWLIFISLDFYNDFDIYSKAPLFYYWTVSNIVLYFILPVLRIIYTNLLKKTDFNFAFIIKVLLIIILVGFIRKMQDYVVYLFLGRDEGSISELLINIYNAQIVNLLFIKRSIMLTIPVFMWTVLYFGIKAWLDLTSEKEKTEKAYLQAREAELKLLRYQLNPHFLFNSLNSVQALIYENHELADKMLTKLSEFLRYSLEHKGKVFVSFKEEIEAIKKYLTIEKIRFEKNLEFYINSTAEANKCKILSFLLQPLIENAIKHGSKTTSIPLIVNIEAKTDQNRLIVKISPTCAWLSRS